MLDIPQAETGNFRRSRSRFLALLLTGVALLASFSTATGDDAGFSSGVYLRETENLPDSARSKLAEQGQSIWHIVKDGGFDARQVFEDVCGTKNEALFKTFLNLNAIAEMKDKIPAGSAVEVPFCLAPARDLVVVAGQGYTLPDLIRNSRRTLSDDKLVEAFAKNYGAFDTHLPSGTASLPQIKSAELKAGSVVNFPDVKDPRLFKAKNGSEKQIIASISANLNTAAREAFSKSIDEPSSNSRLGAAGNGSRPELMVPTSLEKQDLQQMQIGANCDSDNGIAALDAASLKQRYRDQVNALEAAGTSASQIIVGVLDTGLGTKAQTFDSMFLEKFFARNDAERPAPPVRDFDNNEHKNDVYGTSIEGDGLMYPSPILAAEERSHGTQIASLVLGGPDYIKLAAVDPFVPIRLLPYNYSPKKEMPFPKVRLEPKFIPSMIDYLVKSRNAKIVNMSFKTFEAPLVFQSAVNKYPDILFVVAAGQNDGGAGYNLNFESIYPAKLGGRIGTERQHVVTVGASDLTGKLAKFSNWSREYVDLLAPGCSVLARDAEGNIRGATGTSISAPLVTFVASLIKSLGMNRTVAIKNRLLASVDYDPQLSEVTQASGVLNPFKAISVQHDVVELANGDRQLLYGLIEPFSYELLMQSCASADDRMFEGFESETLNLRKVSFFTRPEVGKKMVRFAYVNSDVFHEMVCDAPGEGIPALKLVILPERQVREISWSDIGDLVRRQ